MTVPITKTQKIKNKMNRRIKPHTIEARPSIELDRNYRRPEAASAAGCSTITIIRAFSNGHLQGYRIGKLVIHSGAQLLAWLEAGGKTGVKGGRVNA
jgi:hypothetical protein